MARAKKTVATHVLQPSKSTPSAKKSLHICLIAAQRCPKYFLLGPHGGGGGDQVCKHGGHLVGPPRCLTHQIALLLLLFRAFCQNVFAQTRKIQKARLCHLERMCDNDPPPPAPPKVFPPLDVAKLPFIFPFFQVINISGFLN